MKDKNRKAMWAKKGQGISSKFLEDEHNKAMNGRMTSFGNPNPPNKFENNWTRHTLHSVEGDQEAIIYRNKKDPELTVELHPMDDHLDASPEDNDTEHDYNAWYIFPARNGKGIPSSPEVISESGGYTKKDAVESLMKLLKETDGDNR